VEWGGDPCGRPAGGRSSHPVGLEETLAVVFGERGLCLRLSSAIPCQRGKLRLLAVDLGEREPLHHRVFSTRKVKISSSHQWDILASLIAPVHSAKYIDIQCVGIHKQLHVSKTLRSGDILKDAQKQYLPSVFPRIAAAICALLLIGSLSLVGVGGVALIGPMFTHGDNAAHADGKILSIGPGRDFVLVTSNGQHLFFQCMDQCLASLAHMQRHLRERAHTDVYFIHGPDKSLMAMNVD